MHGESENETVATIEVGPMETKGVGESTKRENGILLSGVVDREKRPKELTC